MYLGNKTEHKKTFIYTVPFCIRRFLLVMCLLAFGASNDRMVIFSVLVLQTAYLGYIAYSEPHLENNFNNLENVNEVAVGILVYIMLAFITDSLLTPNQQWFAGYMAGGILLTVFLINIGVMLKMTFNKVSISIKRSKEKKAVEAAKLKVSVTLKEDEDIVRLDNDGGFYGRKKSQRNALLDPIEEDVKEENVNQVDKITKRPIALIHEQYVGDEIDNGPDTGRAQMVSPGKSRPTQLPLLIDPNVNIPNPN